MGHPAPGTDATRQAGTQALGRPALA